MCYQLVNAVYEFNAHSDKPLTGTQTNVLAFLAHCAKPNSPAFPSVNTICARTGLSESAVKTARRELRKRGLIQEIGTTAGGVVKFLITLGGCLNECRGVSEEQGGCSSEPQINNITNNKNSYPLAAGAASAAENFEDQSEAIRLVKKSPPPVQPPQSRSGRFQPKVCDDALVELITLPVLLKWKDHYRQAKRGLKPTQEVVDGMVTQLLIAQQAGAKPADSMAYMFSKGWVTFEWEWAKRAFKSANQENSISDMLNDISWADEPAPAIFA